MGLYYQPPPPHIGAAQPLTPKKLTPPSGPLPSNPVFGRPSLAATLVAAWSVAAVPLPQQSPRAAAIVPAPIAQRLGPSPPQPYVWAQADWPQPPRRFLTQSGPAPTNPPINGGAAVPQAVLAAWIPPPPLPIVVDNISPPITGPVPQAPPVRVQSVPTEVLIGWIPPPPSPIVAVNLDPPIAGPAPQNPPFMGGAEIPPGLLVSWIPGPPSPIVAVNLSPPISGPTTPQAPPPRSQTTPLEVLIGWQQAPPPLPLPPLIAATATFQAPPFQPAPNGWNAVAAVVWAKTDWPLPTQAPRLTASGPLPQPPPVRIQSVLTEILIGWLSPAQAPVIAGSRVPFGVAPPAFLARTRPGAAEILISWTPVTWSQPGPRKLTASGPAPTAPPGRIWSVPREVLIGWLPAPPQPALPWKVTASGAPTTARWGGNVWWITASGNPGDRAWVSIGIGPNPAYQARLRSLYLVLSGSAAGSATMVVRDGPTGTGAVIFEADLYTAANSWDFLDFNEVDLRASVGNVLTVEFVAGTPGDVQEINAGGDYVAPGTLYGV